MKIEEARGHACGWLEQNSGQLAGFVGAYLAGSTAWADRKAEFRAGSDVDLLVVVNGPDLPKNCPWSDNFTGNDRIVQRDRSCELPHAPSMDDG